ncbi:hypothetical protein [Roseofilum sp. Guam]|uniref:hypothetical protein n=1 Tax=Roseofilum sp. Guam TaxID=2821502 RepID=UPI001B093A24|nr:hypothetical protein [Roseofilum sp. Guam]MBP0030748.1 hypothetical protein [Roseofilum sp. Guam]
MSKGSRIAIAIVSLISAVGFFMTALDPSGLPAGASVFYGLAILCIVIAIACLFPQTHPVTLRIIGTVIFCAYIAYVMDSFQTDNLGRAIVGFMVWGIPSGYLAVMGRYPSWGAASEGLNPKDDQSKIE